MSGDSWHFIRPNEANRYPRRIVCFDTEALQKETSKYERQTFRLAAVSFDLFRAGQSEPVKSETSVEFEPESLWQWIDARCKSKSRTVVFAHNLSYDLRLSDAFRILYALGWRPAFFAIDSNRCVARYRKNGASLLLCDLTSWLPCSLDKVADSLGMKKAPLPKANDQLDAWVNRCVRDVEITRVAALRIVNWLEVNDLGSFRLTGPAQAMAAYRHRFMRPYSMLVHKDPDALAAERRAVWAGRCEVWQHGEVTGPLYEWDYRTAYLNIALTTNVPVRFRGSAEGLSVANLLRLAKNRSIVSDCIVDTERPVVPCRTKAGIAWPIGRFETTLWDNEIRLARENGAEIQPVKSWVYMRFPALVDWAIWLSQALGPNGLPVDALERIMLKDWARSLIGRFGARWPQWEKIATLPESGLELLPYIDKDTGAEGAYLQNGHDWFERSGYVDAPDAMPAVMGYIMAEARCRLWRAMQRAGLGNVAYVDTDSLIVNAAGNANLQQGMLDTNLANLICKAEYKRGLFLGPRQIKLNSELRVAGLPKTAIQKSARTFEAELWEGLAESIRRNHPNEVRVYRRRVTLHATDNRRHHLTGTATAPFMLTLVDNPPVEGFTAVPS
jgi:hypothetical protein